MYTQPGEAEEANRRACRRMGIEVPYPAITGKQLIVLLIGMITAGIACLLIFG